MSHRPFRTRVLAGTAIALAAIGAGGTAAHAAQPTDPHATANVTCDPYPNQTNLLANLHVHLSNGANAPQHAHFVVTVKNSVPHLIDLAPGQSKTDEWGLDDGVPSHLSVVADGTPIIDEMETPKCNKPHATIKFECVKYPVKVKPSIWYQMDNWSMAPVVFNVHQQNGKVYDAHLGGMMGYREIVPEDAVFSVFVKLDGKTVATLSGTADCLPPVKTPPTKVPPTKITTATTFVGQRHAGAGATNTTTTTAKTARLAAAEKSLPMTGSTSAPLGLAGLALVSGGCLAMLLARRRARSV